MSELSNNGGLGTPEQVIDLNEADAEAALIKNIRLTLEKSPFTILNVHPRPEESDMCPVVFSVGLTKHGFPEIIAGGHLDIEIMATLADNVASYWLDRGEVQLGEQDPAFFQDSNGRNLPLVIRPIDSQALTEESEVSVLKMFHDGMLPAMVQLLFTALDGKLPSDDDYDQLKYFQPLLPALDVAPE